MHAYERLYGTRFRLSVNVQAIFIYIYIILYTRSDGGKSIKKYYIIICVQKKSACGGCRTPNSPNRPHHIIAHAHARVSRGYKHRTHTPGRARAVNSARALLMAVQWKSNTHHNTISSLIYPVSRALPECLLVVMLGRFV